MKKLVSIFVLVIWSVSFTDGMLHAQQAAGSENELRKQADKSFAANDFEAALNPYSQLLSLKSADPVLNYRYGVCLLLAGKEKTNAASFLENASKNPIVPTEVWYYLGRAYMVNGLFEEALKSFQKYNDQKPRQKRPDADLLLTNARNAIELKKSPKQMTILSEREEKANGFSNFYDFSNAGGRLVPTADQFATSVDREKQKELLMFITNDKQTILLSSYGKRPDQGKDIYIIRRQANGSWGVPENLGTTINTLYDEDFPMLDRDGKTMYFSSKGHNSIGGYDLFKSELDLNSGQWSAPVNLGLPVNTVYDDFCLLSSGDGKTYTYTTLQHAGNNNVIIRNVELPGVSANSVRIAGTYAPIDQRVRRDARITVMNSGGKGIIATTNTDPRTGNYELFLPPGSEYMLVVEGGGYLPHAEIFNLPEGVANATNLRQIVKLNKTKEKEILTLQNYFSQTEAPTEIVTRSYSAVDTAQMVALTINNQTIRVTAPTSEEQKTYDVSNSAETTKQNLPSIKLEKKDKFDPTLDRQLSDDEIRQRQEEESRSQEIAHEDRSADIKIDDNISNDEIVRMAYNDAKSIQYEADNLKKEAVRIRGYAEIKDSLATDLKQAASEAPTEAERKDNLAEAETLQNEAIELFSQANDLDQLASQKQKQADEALQEVKTIAGNDAALIARIENDAKKRADKNSAEIAAIKTTVKTSAIAQNTSTGTSDQSGKKDSPTTSPSNTATTAQNPPGTTTRSNDSVQNTVAGSEPNATKTSTAQTTPTNVTKTTTGTIETTDKASVTENSSPTIAQNTSPNTGLNSTKGSAAETSKSTGAQSSPSTGGENSTNVSTESTQSTIAQNNNSGSVDNSTKGTTTETTKSAVDQNTVSGTGTSTKDSSSDTGKSNVAQNTSSGSTTSDKSAPTVTTQPSLAQNPAGSVDNSLKNSSAQTDKSVVSPGTGSTAAENATKGVGTQSNIAQNTNSISGKNGTNTSAPTTSTSSKTEVLANTADKSTDPEVDNRASSIGKDNAGTTTNSTDNKTAAKPNEQITSGNTVAPNKTAQQSDDKSNSIASEQNANSTGTTSTVNNVAGKSDSLPVTNNSSNTSTGTQSSTNPSANNNNTVKGVSTSSPSSEKDNVAAVTSKDNKTTDSGKTTTETISPGKPNGSGVEGTNPNLATTTSSQTTKTSAANASDKNVASNNQPATVGGEQPSTNATSTKDSDKQTTPAKTTDQQLASPNATSGNTNTSLAENKNPDQKINQNTGTNDVTAVNSVGTNQAGSNPSVNSAGTPKSPQTSSSDQSKIEKDQLVNKTVDSSTSATLAENKTTTGNSAEQPKLSDATGSEKNNTVSGVQSGSGVTQNAQADKSTVAGNSSTGSGTTTLGNTTGSSTESPTGTARSDKQLTNADTAKNSVNSPLVSNNSTGANTTSKTSGDVQQKVSGENTSTALNQSSDKSSVLTKAASNNLIGQTETTSGTGSRSGMNDSSLVANTNSPASSKSNQSTTQTTPVNAANQTANSLQSKSITDGNNAVSPTDKTINSEVKIATEKTSTKPADSNTVSTEKQNDQTATSTTNKASTVKDTNSNSNDLTKDIASIERVNSSVESDSTGQTDFNGVSIVGGKKGTVQPEVLPEADLETINTPLEARTAYQAYKLTGSISNRLSVQSEQLQDRISAMKPGSEKDSLIRVANEMTMQSIRQWQESQKQLADAVRIDPQIENKVLAARIEAKEKKQKELLAQETVKSNAVDNTTSGSSTTTEVNEKSSQESSVVKTNANDSQNTAAENPVKPTIGTQSAEPINNRTTDLAENKSVSKEEINYAAAPKAEVKTDSLGLNVNHPRYAEYVETQKKVTAKQVETIDVFAEAVNLNKKATDEKQLQIALLDSAYKESDERKKADLQKTAEEYKRQSEEDMKMSEQKFAVAKDKTGEAKKLSSEAETIKTQIKSEPIAMANPISGMDEAQSTSLTANTNSSNNSTAANNTSAANQSNTIQSGNSTKERPRSLAEAIRRSTPDDLKVTADQLANQPEPEVSELDNFASTSFSKSIKPVYSATNPVPMDVTLPEGLVFKVQIGAFRKPISGENFKNVQPLTGESTRVGWIRYCVGLFKTFEPANTVKKEMRNLGYKDAFVVAYYNGKRIQLNEAYAMVNKDQQMKTAYQKQAVKEVAILKAMNIDPVASTIETDQDERSFYASAKTNAKQSKTASVSLANETASTADDIVYSVQIGVYRSAKTPAALNNLNPIEVSAIRNGLYRFTFGVYTFYADAEAAKKEARSKGISDAFIIAYKNGQRVSPTAAARITDGSATASYAVVQKQEQAPVATPAPQTPVMPATQKTEEAKTVTTSTQAVNNPAAMFPVENTTSTNGKLVFKVQIGAFRQMITYEKVLAFLAVSDKGITQLTDDRGLHIFYVGNCTDFTCAQELRQEVLTKGIADAFVVALKDGKRIEITDDLKK